MLLAGWAYQILDLDADVESVWNRTAVAHLTEDSARPIRWRKAIRKPERETSRTVP
jgi:hypothetical protein